MHFAATFGSLDLVKLLDEHGGDALLKNNEDICPIDIAINGNQKELTLYFMSQ
jgi:hypothetical protein